MFIGSETIILILLGLLIAGIWLLPRLQEMTHLYDIHCPTGLYHPVKFQVWVNRD